ncbi:hypothetical protein EI94DRAFT_251158 [Lactarius quietus]|nr:hypothetical protein EI94DRAFT_251158 [Lactarius quietus]
MIQSQTLYIPSIHLATRNEPHWVLKQDRTVSHIWPHRHPHSQPSIHRLIMSLLQRHILHISQNNPSPDNTRIMTAYLGFLPPRCLSRVLGGESRFDKVCGASCRIWLCRRVCVKKAYGYLQVIYYKTFWTIRNYCIAVRQGRAWLLMVVTVPRIRNGLCS